MDNSDSDISSNNYCSIESVEDNEVFQKIQSGFDRAIVRLNKISFNGKRTGVWRYHDKMMSRSWNYKKLTTPEEKLAIYKSMITIGTATTFSALIGVIFASLDIVFDWVAIIYNLLYGKAEVIAIIASFVLGIGWGFNLIYILRNILSLKYIWTIHSLLSDSQRTLSMKKQSPSTCSIFLTGQTLLETKDEAEEIENCVYNLHCSSFTLFGLSYVSRETHNIELLLETLPQLIIQIYMVLFYETVIPGWRIFGFFISFLSVGNAMRNSVVGKWEYYYFEHNGGEGEGKNEIREPIIYTYPIPAQLVNCLAHSCIISSAALGLAHIFLQSIWIGIGFISIILCCPLLQFFILKYVVRVGRISGTWQNRYMWFFTATFSLLESSNFNPVKRSSLGSFTSHLVGRGIVYVIMFVILLYLRSSNSLLLSSIVLSTLGIGSILMVVERFLFSYHVSKNPFVLKTDEDEEEQEV